MDKQGHEAIGETRDSSVLQGKPRRSSEHSGASNAERRAEEEPPPIRPGARSCRHKRRRAARIPCAVKAPSLHRHPGLPDAAVEDAEHDDERGDDDEDVAGHEIEPAAERLGAACLRLLLAKPRGQTQKNMTAAKNAPTGMT